MMSEIDKEIQMQVLDLKNTKVDQLGMLLAQIADLEAQAEAVPKYKNMNELQMSRDVDRRTFNYSETATIMNRSQQLQTEDDMRRAFKLAQQDEVVRDLNKKWMAQFNAIEN
jgi:hypothetical protein